jgi:hypothetical protein
MTPRGRDAAQLSLERMLAPNLDRIKRINRAVIYFKTMDLLLVLAGCAGSRCALLEHAPQLCVTD